VAFYAGQKLKASNFGAQATCAQYDGASAQTIGTGSDTVIAFGTASVTSSYVSRSTSGAGHSFTVLASGIWAITVNVRWSTSGASATGEKSIHLETGGLWIASSTIGAETDAAVSHHISYTSWLASGTTLQVEAFQNSGGDESLDANVFHGVPRINFALILKEG
jgi:hypothetical protein